MAKVTAEYIDALQEEALRGTVNPPHEIAAVASHGIYWGIELAKRFIHGRSRRTEAPKGPVSAK